MKYSSRYRDRPKAPETGFLDKVNDYTRRLERLGLPEHEARTFAVRLIKHKMGIE